MTHWVTSESDNRQPEFGAWIAGSGQEGLESAAGCGCEVVTIIPRRGQNVEMAEWEWWNAWRAGGGLVTRSLYASLGCGIWHEMKVACSLFSFECVR